MKKFVTVALLISCALGVAAIAWTDTRATGESPDQAAERSGSGTPDTSRAQDGGGRSTADLQRYWDEVHAFLKQGAYRDALQSLTIILSITPNDPRVPLYKTLCERRLQATQAFQQLSPSALASLTERLEQEEQEQRRTTAQLDALERQLRKEQATWDQTLKTIQRDTERQGQLRARQAKAEAQRTRRIEPAVPPSGAPLPLPSEAAPPKAEVGTSGQAAGSGVELAPVIIQAVPEPGVERLVEAQSLVGRPKPPAGAVQINARQMSVSPDQRIAIADGDVEVVFENAVLTCDHLTLFTDTKDAYAEGRVRIEEGNQVFRGEMAHYNFNTKKGRFLQGTVSSPPWHEHGRSVEHVAEGVYHVRPGYLTSCELEPPHFKFYGRRATVFAEDKLARIRNAAIVVEQLPFLYLPWLTLADRQSPFFIIPGKKKPWEQFALMGYRYEWPEGHQGALRLDWRRAFGWATGIDHRFETERLGKGLVKLYYNEEQNRRRPRAELPKGADVNRYRALVRHVWKPRPTTSVLTNVSEFSDPDFRKELLFREEFTREESDATFISIVETDPGFSLSGLVTKRMNRFDTVDEQFPEVTLETGQQQVGDSSLFNATKFEVANLQTKRAHSDNDTDVIRIDWFQQLRYALNLFRPILVTPRAGVRQTYYTKDQQGGSERPDGKRDLISGQFSMGADASLKLFRVFPVTTNALGLDINWLRHVVTPTVAYSYIHQPTVPNNLLNFARAEGISNSVTLGLENKLQTKRKLDKKGKPRSVDLARWVLSVPYTFHGNGNKQGGRFGDWDFDMELYPWPWMRLESDWSYPSHFLKGSRDSRVTRWNLDLVMVGGRGALDAPRRHGEVQAPERRAFEAGPKGALVELLLPEGQWYFGLGHRYFHNAKTEEVIQFDWRLGKKWEIGTFHRLTLKEVAGSSKRFNNVREYQYILRRDLHDWIGELVYRVDREFGEELFFTLTLKAYPELPIETGDSYHQPKIGSQNSPFSPLQGQHPGG